MCVTVLCFLVCWQLFHYDVWPTHPPNDCSKVLCTLHLKLLLRMNSFLHKLDRAWYELNVNNAHSTSCTLFICEHRYIPHVHYEFVSNASYLMYTMSLWATLHTSCTLWVCEQCCIRTSCTPWLCEQYMRTYIPHVHYLYVNSTYVHTTCTLFVCEQYICTYHMYTICMWTVHTYVHTRCAYTMQL
jgi:hypothetical protein